MTTEEKDLLRKDLCARLAYHVRCKIWIKDGTTEEGLLDLEHNYADVLLNAFYYDNIKDIKPYLRPMSSMTEEEKKELEDEINKDFKLAIIACKKNDISKSTSGFYKIDWLNAHHFDYRGLIEKGLAISVTEENNPYK